MENPKDKIINDLLKRTKSRNKQIIIFITIISLFLIFFLSFFYFVDFGKNTINPKDTSVLDKENASFDCLGKDKNIDFCINRQLSIDLISDISDNLRILEDRNILQWNEKDYLKLKSFYDVGNRSFLLKKYKKSKDEFNLALLLSEELINQSEKIYLDGISMGLDFLRNGNPSLAKEKFEEAGLIKVNDPDVIEGIYRSEVYEEIDKLIKEINVLIETNKINEAFLLSRKALSLDKKNLNAKDLYEILALKILERDYAEFIKIGNSSLVNENIEEGLKAFNEALSLKPGSEIAKKGIQNLLIIQKRLKINKLFSEAENYEITEQWKKSFDAYQNIILEEENIIKAQSGFDRVKNIIEIKKNIELYLSNPQRLSENIIREEANNLLGLSEQIISNFYSLYQKTPKKFSNLKNELKKLISKMQIPVIVRFISDNKTTLIISRIGSFDPFNEKVINLRPGTYEIFGRKRGHKEKRLLINITSDFKKPIRIVCDERI